MEHGYRLNIDLADFSNNSDLRRFSLRQYSLPFCTIFLEAKSPDDATHRALAELIQLLLDQHSDVWTRILCRKIRRRIKITKIQAVQ